MGKKAEREAPRAAAELEDPKSGAELTVLDKDLGGAVFVERLCVLARFDSIVDASGLFARERGHIERDRPPFLRRLTDRASAASVAEHRLVV